jgi:hypothetical protein
LGSFGLCGQSHKTEAGTVESYRVALMVVRSKSFNKKRRSEFNISEEPKQADQVERKPFMR